MGEPVFKVALRGGYADRNGIVPVNTEMQIDDFDTRTRIAIRNSVAAYLQGRYRDDIYSSADGSKFCRALLANVYLQPADYRNNYVFAQILPTIESTIYYDTYGSILSLLEFIIDYCSHGNFVTKQELANKFNKLFEREYVGYRYVANGFSRITDEIEANSIEKALNAPYSKVREHIAKAHRYLADREHPDYENSIKESITAVEEICQSIVGKKCTLGDALDNLSKAGVNIHPALKAAFDKLYGYTCDASGVRHAGQLGGVNSTFDEAKYMLISCCAFVNYLIGIQANIS